MLDILPLPVHRLLRLAPFVLIAAGPALTVAPGRCDKSEAVRWDLPAVKQLQREMANEGDRHIAEAIERRREVRRHRATRTHGVPARAERRDTRTSGERVRPDRPRDGQPFDETPIHGRFVPASPAPGEAITALPPNVRLNNPVGDGASSAQSEVGIAMVGSNGIAAWNDGQGFILPPNGQGVAYTTTAGAVWTDVGLPPLAGTISDWVSDPIVAVNERTGDFYFCSITDNGPSNSGLAVVRATFPGGVFTWDTPHVIQDLPATTDFLDKPWMVADSVTGNLYLTYTHFFVGGSTIGFQRSTNGGLTWEPEIVISTSSGNVQGSRPAVAGDGTLYVTWKEIGTTDADFLRVRRSTNHGVSFEPQHNAFSYYDNFGTGGPGFNRNRNVVEPCPVVDRTLGPHRGRLYTVLHESLDYFDDAIGGGGNRIEVENNNFFGSATPFTVGQKLRGTLSSTGPDLDVYSFTATAGTSYIFFCDSIPRPLYTLRVFCGLDTLTRLAYSGDIDAPAGAQSLILWTAPASGTYYLRIAFVTVVGSSFTGNYRIQTGIATHGSEVGRDQRDIVLHYSDDGGATWSAAKRVNDEPALYDDFLPEVGIGSEGFPYCAWFDFRDASSSCGGRSHLYVNRSLDGGDSWGASQRVSTLPTAWTTAATNIAPNMGDYIGLCGGDRVALAWADARAGEADVNVWGTTVPTLPLASCPPDTTLPAGSVLQLALSLTNPNPLFANIYGYGTSIDRNWTLSGSGSVTVAENGGVGTLPVTVTIPDTAGGTAHVCVVVTLGAATQTCCFDVTVQGAVAVTDRIDRGFAIHHLAPNPARRGLAVTFSLSSSAPARIELLDVNGRLIASRDVGSLGPGRHVASFDREVATLSAGVYAVKLRQDGRDVTCKVAVLK